MIDNFVALSANERTYLAWIRTAVAIMGFGFLIDKLDITQSNPIDPIISTILVILGVFLLGFSGIRFLSLNRRILSTTRESAFQWRFYVVFTLINLALSVLVLTFVVGML